MTRSHSKHSTTAKTSEASGVETAIAHPEDATSAPSPVFRWVKWVWAVAFLILLVQALLDLIYGSIFGAAGR